jgi:hypothetical protein
MLQTSDSVFDELNLISIRAGNVVEILLRDDSKIPFGAHFGFLHVVSGALFGFLHVALGTFLTCLDTALRPFLGCLDMALRPFLGCLDMALRPFVRLRNLFINVHVQSPDTFHEETHVLLRRQRSGILSHEARSYTP